LKTDVKFQIAFENISVLLVSRRLVYSWKRRVIVYPFYVPRRNKNDMIIKPSPVAAQPFNRFELLFFLKEYKDRNLTS